jgi:hypothetical protein
MNELEVIWWKMSRVKNLVLLSVSSSLSLLCIFSDSIATALVVYRVKNTGKYGTVLNVCREDAGTRTWTGMYKQLCLSLKQGAIFIFP